LLSLREVVVVELLEHVEVKQSLFLCHCLIELALLDELGYFPLELHIVRVVEVFYFEVVVGLQGV